MTYNMPSGTAKHCKCIEPESRGFLLLSPDCSFSSDGLVQMYSTQQKLGRSLGMRLQISSILHRAARALAHRFFKH